MVKYIKTAIINILQKFKKKKRKKRGKHKPVTERQWKIQKKKKQPKWNF